ncbi:Sec-independent protein translocase protein TatB [Methylobacterium sp. NEAU 140]|uniref:Sec-independent protein translocase protein TatB n=1 Tax=Methylobacterium sp. NEAU 140 TaxID=3064945 RepID=UPI0027359086|nr:Sec-independent protein translocase protein TatB [Methylobacterium sp. NEAU 140]MDP4025891.1 Sec-independent protein translocase protein TatB [Methylobacterium sp. NEAU 140]
MLDMSWGEVMLIGGVALIVIGPKDLPKALRTVGQITTKLRRMAGEFQMQFNEAIREAELDEVRKEVDSIRGTVRSASGFNPVQTIRDELKGAVEGRARTPGASEAQADAPAVQDPGPPVTYGPEKPAAAGPETSAKVAPEPEPQTPAPAPRPRSLADATARLKAEREAAQGAPAPLPVPGSIDDPFGMPEPPPAPAGIAQNGAAAR